MFCFEIIFEARHWQEFNLTLPIFMETRTGLSNLYIGRTVSKSHSIRFERSAIFDSTAIGIFYIFICFTNMYISFVTFEQCVLQLIGTNRSEMKLASALR